MTPTPRLRTYYLTVLLARQLRTRGDGYDPADEHLRAAVIRVEATSPADACEVAWALANSHPAEMHCDEVYLPQVEAYRTRGHRSMSVGDAVELADGAVWSAESFGFRQQRPGRLEERDEGPCCPSCYLAGRGEVPQLWDPKADDWTCLLHDWRQPS